MGLIGKFTGFFKRKLFNGAYWKLVFLVLLVAIKKHKGGTFRWRGAKFRYNDASALAGMYNEIMYMEHYKFIPVNKSPLILDCGANIGMSVLYFSKLIPGARITAVEADPDIFGVLKANCERNKIDADLINKAIWTSDDDTLKFGRAGADAGSLKSTHNTVDVKTVRLKRLLDEAGDVELLKMDIEGSEVSVMSDCVDSLQRTNKIFVEYHSFPGERQDLDILLRTLTDAGFRYLVLPARKMSLPFINRMQNEAMDLQLNIFAFRN